MEVDDARMAVTDLHHKEADQVHFNTAQFLEAEIAMRGHPNQHNTGQEAHLVLMGTAQQLHIASSRSGLQPAEDLCSLASPAAVLYRGTWQLLSRRLRRLRSNPHSMATEIAAER